MKVVIMFFVIFIFWAIGENIANNSKNKILFYKNYIKFAKFLKINIYSYNDNISCVMDKYISSIDGHKDKLHFKNLKKEITVPCHQKDNISDIYKNLNLNDAEINDIKNFVIEIGKSNLDMQITHIDGYINLFDSQLEKYQQEYREKGLIIKKICIYIGVAIAILIM